jgi:hypothetical protein
MEAVIGLSAMDDGFCQILRLGALTGRSLRTAPRGNAGAVSTFFKLL